MTCDRVAKTYRCFFGASLALTVALIDGAGIAPSVAQTPRETPPDILAVQLRSQGYACEKPQDAARDNERSKPDQPVWILKCENVTYRMQLTPGMAAKVERLE
jgi:hypothetical protein